MPGVGEVIEPRRDAGAVVAIADVPALDRRAHRPRTEGAETGAAGMAHARIDDAIAAGGAQPSAQRTACHVAVRVEDGSALARRQARYVVEVLVDVADENA